VSAGRAPGTGIALVREFRQFVVRGNVVDLAVAVVIGAAFGTVVNALVSDLITPLIGALFGGPQFFGGRTFTLNGSVFRWGDLVNAVVTFVLIAAVVFFVVVKPVNVLMARAAAREEPAPRRTRSCPECVSQIALAARRCPYCTSSVEPAGA
jgi:large conductance mechanosensitive channel